MNRLQGVEEWSREILGEAVAIIQARDDQDGGRGGGEKGSDFGCILEVEPTVFARGEMQGVKERKVSRKNGTFSSLNTQKNTFPSTEMEKVVGIRGDFITSVFYIMLF